MSKRSAKPAGPITRRQQVAAIRQVKGQEIAEAVSTKIREAVKQEVEQQLSVIKSTMLDLIDRVVDLEQEREGNRDDRPKRTEAVAVQQDDEVVQGEVVEGPDRSGEDGEESS